VEEGFAVELLPEGATLPVLGTALHLEDPTKLEMENRIATAWRMFWGMSKLLTNQKISINRRLRVFDSTVGSCVMWCTESWTPRAEELRLLERARRAMLRKIVGLRQGADEEWIDWLRRSTHRAMALSDELGLSPWITTHLTKKWHWAGHVARRGGDTWLHRTTCWRDTSWQEIVGNLAGRPMRPSRRRWMKWEQLLHQYSVAKGSLHWMTAARTKEDWNKDVGGFLEWHNAK